jgi:hypothetical protein
MPKTSLARSCLLVLLFARAAIAFADSPPAAQPAAPATKSFAGQWITTYGVMTLKQTGDAITGVYGPSDNPISGTVAGDKFSFTYTEPAAKGEGWFVLAADGNQISGKWREAGSNLWQDWIGKRKLYAQSDNFTGLWKTTFGKMRLHQTGKTVTGIYDFGGTARISGAIEGQILKFTYEQPDGEKGEGTFNLAADAQSFNGTWKGNKAGAIAGGAWSASRILPQPGRVWLVVLEANWERDLEEEEYSFGVMLRTFFARVPAVKVRHRFFGDEAEFRRWCAELPYLAEPVYLHISSHGDKDGIHTGGKIIGAKTLAECLRDIDDLRLLHFGTCLVAGGDIPKQLYAQLGPSATFPISGYANIADWSGSAVIDFTYLDLIFSRNMTPKAAFNQTRRMLTFAGSHHNEGDAIAPAGLVMIEPPSPATAPAK